MKGLSITQDQLTLLYRKGLSAAEIADKLNASENKIVYWLDKFKIPKRSISEAIYLKNNPKGDPFLIKEGLSPEEKYLLGLGLGIYWGEGDKTSKGKVSVSNTDPRLIQNFIEFLVRICGIKMS